MSIGFRIFLLTLLGFGAVWMYRFRGPELEFLLDSSGLIPPRPTYAQRDRARGRLQPPAKVGFENLGTQDWQGVERWAPERDPDLALTASEVAVDGVIPLVVTDPPDSLPRGGQGPGSRDEEAGEAVRVVDLPTETIEILYAVADGDNLWKVAKKFLGRGTRYEEIMILNSLTDAKLVPGTQLRLRVPSDGRRKESLKSPPPLDDNSVEEGSKLRGNPLPRTHKVTARETLGRIARKYFPSDPAGVEILFEANKEKLSSPDLVYEGQVLVIPAFRPERTSTR